MDARPIGVFDSGVGGLTVLHECLVTMPNEDFVYLGDHARLPYGPRPLAEIARFAYEIARYLELAGVKLIVVACNAATSAALPALQASLAVPVIGVIAPEAAAAVRATRNRRIGLLATQATVSAGRYRTLVETLDAGVRFTAVACPELVPLIESGDQTADAVRSLRRAAPAGRLRHRHPRLHPLSADPPGVRARLRPRRHARLLGRGDGPRGRRDARPQGVRERRRTARGATGS